MADGPTRLDSTAMSPLHRTLTRTKTSVLEEFDPDAYQLKAERAMKGVCNVVYRNSKGEDLHSSGFLCTLRLQGRGNVYGLMTNSQTLERSVLQSSRYLFCDVFFVSQQVEQRHYTLALRRDVESWFNDDVKHLDVTFLELRPDLQLTLVQNGCVFLRLDERQRNKTRNVFILSASQNQLVNGHLLANHAHAHHASSVFRLTEQGMLASPVFDEEKFTVVGVCRTGETFRKELASDPMSIVKAVEQVGLKHMPVFEARKTLFSRDETLMDTKAKILRLDYIQDSMIIPFYMKSAISDRLLQCSILTAEDLFQCSETNLEKLFKQPSILKVINSWKGNERTKRDGSLSPRQPADDDGFYIHPYRAQAIASLIINAPGEKAVISKTMPAAAAKPTEREYYKKWTKSPRGHILQMPGYIRSIIAIPENAKMPPVIVVISADGHLVALSGHDWKTLEWKCLIQVDGGEINVIHAVYDSVVDCIYLTATTSRAVGTEKGNCSEDGAGTSQLYRARISSLVDNEKVSLRVLAEPAVLDGRNCWGLAIDCATRLLLVCDNGGSHGDVSVWRLMTPDPASRRKKMLYPVIQLMASLRAPGLIVSPMFCAFSATPGLQCQLFIAVADDQSRKVELFCGLVDEAQMEPSKLIHKGTLGKRDSMSPWKPGTMSMPCQLSFDDLGNLLTADQANRRLAIFAPSQPGGHQPYELHGVWQSRRANFTPERFALATSPKTGATALLTLTDFNILTAFDTKVPTQ